VCSTEIWVLKGKAVINKYLFYLVQSELFYRISTITFGSKMPRADWEFVSSFPIDVPTEKEQKKIATFLHQLTTK
jgi:type I restriction enzyme S subunit